MKQAAFLWAKGFFIRFFETANDISIFLLALEEKSIEVQKLDIFARDLLGGFVCVGITNRLFLSVMP